jgi:hypothetical protein
MRAVHAVLLALALSAAAWAAPAPLPKEPRHAPSPEQVAERLRAEGYDVSKLRHVGGPRWLTQVRCICTTDGRSPPTVVWVSCIVSAPGDPTDRLRKLLRKK